MREYELFLTLLAARVFKARLASGARVLDASDFHAWLLELAARAARSESLEEFFSKIE